MLSIKIFCFNWRSLVRGRYLFKDRFWHLKELMYLHQHKGQPHKKKLITLQHAGMANKRSEYILHLHLHQVSKPGSILRLTICSISFGTGINRPNKELVAHWGAYGSVMDYRQEEDRTDRDSRASKAMCYTSKNHLVSKFKEDLIVNLMALQATYQFTKMFLSIYLYQKKVHSLKTFLYFPETLYIQQSCLSFFWIFDNFVFKVLKPWMKTASPVFKQTFILIFFEQIS